MATGGIEKLLGKHVSEYERRFTENGYNWEVVKVQLEKIAETEAIDRKLGELEGNIDERFEYLKGLYEKAKAAEAPLEGSGKLGAAVGVSHVPEVVKDPAAEARKALVGKVDDKLKSRVGLFVSFFYSGEDLVGTIENASKGTGMDKMKNIVSGFFAKLFLGWLGIKDFQKDLDKVKAAGLAVGATVAGAASAGLATAAGAVEKAGEEAPLVASKSVAKAFIATESAKYVKEDYTQENWDTMQKAKEKGNIDIDRATDTAGVETAKNVAIDAMGKVEKLKKEVDDAGKEVDPEALTERKTIVKGGFNFLKLISGVTFTPNSDDDQIFTFLKAYSFDDLKTKFEACIKDEKRDPQKMGWLKDQFSLHTYDGLTGDKIFDVLLAFFVRNSRTIYSQRLNPENLKSTLCEEGKETLKAKYSTLISPDQYEILVRDGFKIDKLNMETVMLLLGLSFGHLIGEGIDSLKKYSESLGIELWEFVIADSTFLATIKPLIESRKKELLPGKVLAKFAEFGSNFGGDEKLLLADGELKNQLGFDSLGLSDIEKQKFEKLITFKNEVLNLGGDSSITLGIEGFDEAFKKGLNFGKVIALYTAFNGDINAYKKDMMSKMFLYTWVLEALDSQDSRKIAADYFAKLTLALDTGEDASTVFTPEEKSILKVLVKKGFGFYSQRAEAQVIRVDSMFLAWFNDYTKSVGLSPEVSTYLYRTLEVGGVGAFFMIFKRLNIVGKFLVGINVLGSVLAYVASKFTYEQLKQEIGDEMLSFLDDQLASGGPVSINGKKMPVRSVTDLYSANENPAQYETRAREVQTYQIDSHGTIIENGTSEFQLDVNNMQGAVVTYKGERYKINVGPDIYDYNDVGITDKDQFQGKELELRAVQLDKSRNMIVIGSGENKIEIPLKTIIDSFSNEKQTYSYDVLLYGSMKTIEYYTLISNGLERTGTTFLSTFAGVAYSFSQENLILEKI